MPSGLYITKEIRELLVYHCCVKGSTPDFVFENLFLPDSVQLQTIEKLWGKLNKMLPEERSAYIEGHHTREKRLLIEGSEELHYLEELLSVNRSVKMRVLTKRFHEEFFPEQCAQLPSLSSVYRAVRLHNSRKHVDWTHVKKNPIEQIEFLSRIAHVMACRLVDIDGMAQTPEDFYNKYGWAPKGEECHRPQISIGGQRYAVHAAFTELGFIQGGWRIFPNTVTDNEVREFVESIKTSLPVDAFGLFDNASNQRTDYVRTAIEDVFDGRFLFCSPYSPELKPIERGFALVKQYIREREIDPTWANDKIGLINAAFHHYSVGQPGGLAAYNLFHVYRDNYEDSMNID